METKKAKVTQVVPNSRSFNSQFGTMYVHLVSFDNGDAGEYNSKSQTCDKFTEGVDTDYTIEVKVNGNFKNTIIKPVKVDTFSGGSKFGGKSSGSIESFALSYSKDLAVALITSKQENVSVDRIILNAEVFYNWLKSKQTN